MIYLGSWVGFEPTMEFLPIEPQSIRLTTSVPRPYYEICLLLALVNLIGLTVDRPTIFSSLVTTEVNPFLFIRDILFKGPSLETCGGHRNRTDYLLLCRGTKISAEIAFMNHSLIT